MIPHDQNIPEVETSAFSWKTKIFVVALIAIAIFASYAIGESIKASKAEKASVSLDARKQILDSLRSQKKENEKKIEELKNQNYDLDQKIIPLKCDIYSEIWAKHTWEDECRQSHEEQKEKILSQEAKIVDEAVVPEYQ